MPDKVNDLDAKYIANTDYVLREIVGEYTLVPTGKLSMKTNEVVTISESAAYLWKKMHEEKSVTQLCKLLLEEYDVDRDVALSDITEMVCSMSTMDIIKKVIDSRI